MRLRPVHGILLVLLLVAGGVTAEFQIVQSPGHVAILTESNSDVRIIPVDGRPHLPSRVRTWLGDARGRWEGNTLVVDVTNFTDDTWIDSHGTFHSDALHVVERWTFAGPDRIHYEVSVEDPKVFTRPWKMAFPVNRNRQAGYEIFEDSRFEGERDVQHILEGGRHEKAAGISGIHEHRREGR